MSKKKPAKTAKAAKARTRTLKAARTKSKPSATATEGSAPPAAAPPKPTKVNIAAAKGRPMLTWVGKRPLSHVTAFPAQRLERHWAVDIADPGLHSDERYHERLQFFGDLRSQMNQQCWKGDPQGFPHVPEMGGLLFHGDNRDVLAYLLANGYRKGVHLVYIDPPFDSGADYVRRIVLRGPKGTAKMEGESYTLGEQIQYTRTLHKIELPGAGFRLLAGVWREFAIGGS